MTHEYDLTEQSDLDMLDEVDGEYYNWDQNHSGYLWLTDECVDKYGLVRGMDVEPIDWENSYKDDDYFDSIFITIDLTHVRVIIHPILYFTPQFV